VSAIKQHASLFFKRKGVDDRGGRGGCSKGPSALIHLNSCFIFFNIYFILSLFFSIKLFLIL
jgi:hypothetical protein